MAARLAEVSGVRIKYYMTCKKCAFNNPWESDSCGGCGTPLLVKQKSGPEILNYHFRWQCPQCGSLIMGGQKKCHRCNYQRRGQECFISTAILADEGKNDDCYELTVIRQYRDDYLQRENPRLIFEYYLHAPLIVAAIDKAVDRNLVYNDIRKSLQTIIAKIEGGSYALAKQEFTDCYFQLKEKYIAMRPV